MSILETRRKQWIRQEYSKTWEAQRRAYGFTAHEQVLCDAILQVVPMKSKGLEVGMGTGYPYCDFLLKRGFDIYGVDIAPRLVEYAKQNYPQGKFFEQDAERLEFGNDFFDFTFCFGVSQYLNNPALVLSEMLRVTRKGGYAFFAIANSLNFANRKHYLGAYTVSYLTQFLVSLAKYLLGKGDTIYWTPHERPTNPNRIYKFLLRVQCSEALVGHRVSVNSTDWTHTEFLDKFLDYPEHRSLIFRIKK